MEIRKMAEADLPRVSELEQVSFSVPWSIDSLTFALRNPNCLTTVLTVDGEIYGYAVGCCLFEELEIMNLAVAPEARRRGYGAALLEALLRAGGEAGCSRALLEVREGNFAAKRLYTCYGFTEYGRRAGYYRRPKEDAILMERRSITHFSEEL